MSDEKEFDFGSLEVIEVPVVGPDGKPYVLREANGDVAARFNNARGKCVQFRDGGMSAVDGQGDLEIFLVSLCLFHVNQNAANWNLEDQSTWTADLKRSVNGPVIRSWLERVVKPLFQKAKEISEIDEAEDLKALKEQRENLDKQIKKIGEDEAKNEQDDTPIGCD